MKKQKYIAEFLGTFALVFCGCGAIVTNDVAPGLVGNAGIAMSFGLIVMAMIYSFGSISGAHINPAVSLAFYLNKQLRSKDVLPYIFSQLLGAIVACLALKGMFSEHETLGLTSPHGSDNQSFILEFVLTFLLMLTIFKVSSSKKNIAQFTGLAVGGVVLLEAYFAGPISGASMNPARSFGPAIVSGNVDKLWIYMLATSLGALASIPFHRLTIIPKKHK